jgi:hypothetical protein
MDLAPSSERLPGSGTALAVPPLLGFVLVVCPAFDMPPVRPLPDDVSAIVRPVGCQAFRRVPSPWFLTTSTVYSAPAVSGLLHPDTEQGSLRFA